MHRYIKQINLKNFGTIAQKKFINSKVLIVGAGGLGTKISEILSRSGVGNINILDYDILDITNLQRQSLYDEDDLAKPKVISLVNKLKKINKDININYINEKLIASNAPKLLNSYDLIIDATDNYETRFLINRVCFENKTPWIFSGILNFEGQSILIDYKNTACLDCILNYKSELLYQPNQNTGIFYPAVLTIASFASSIALNYLKGNFTDFSVLYVFNYETMNFKKITLNKKANCITCFK